MGTPDIQHPAFFKENESYISDADSNVYFIIQTPPQITEKYEVISHKKNHKLSGIIITDI